MRRRSLISTTTGTTGEGERVARERGFPVFLSFFSISGPLSFCSSFTVSLSHPLLSLASLSRFSLPLSPPPASPLFVTWDSVCRSSGLKSLRGCIGSLSPQPLADGLRSYALTSALRDRRFSPIARREVSSLHCSVSLLRAFEEGLRWSDWVPGRHGIIIEFEEPDDSQAGEAGEAREEDGGGGGGGGEGGGDARRRSRSLRSRLLGGGSPAPHLPPSRSPGPPTARKSVLSATYLPHVAPEQGWGVEEAIHSLVRKAGFGGKVTEALKRELRLTRYESSMAGMGWREYQRERERAAGE